VNSFSWKISLFWDGQNKIDLHVASTQKANSLGRVLYADPGTRQLTLAYQLSKLPSLTTSDWVRGEISGLGQILLGDYYVF
jgi:hypothetical protein